MKEGNPNLIQSSEREEHFEKQEQTPIKERRREAYSEMIQKMENYEGSLSEATQIMFRERLAKNGPEAAVGTLELLIETAKGNKERYAEERNAFSEEAWTSEVQSLESMKTELCLYCDALDKSEEQAERIRSRSPWVAEKLEEGKKLVEESVEEGVVHETTDDYDGEAGLQKAA